MSVVLDDEHSESVAVDPRVSQGAVMDPSFLCHINDLPENVSPRVRLLADDCWLYRTINSQADHIALQNDLTNPESLVSDGDVKFNAKIVLYPEC